MCRAGAYTQVDAVVDTEKELAELGYPLPMNSLFRGCKCCFYTEAGDAGNANSMQVMQAENLRMTVGPRPESLSYQTFLLDSLLCLVYMTYLSHGWRTAHRFSRSAS